MVVHEKHLPEIINISMALQYWQDVIDRAQKLPLVYGMWAEGEGEQEKTCYAHEILMMTPQEFHGLLVAGVIAHAKQKVAELRAALERKGVMTDRMPVALAPPAEVLKITDQTKAAPTVAEPVPTRKKRKGRR